MTTRLLIYEYLTATGLGHEPGSELHSLYREGVAMRDALVDDFGRINDFEIVRVDNLQGEVPAETIRRLTAVCQEVIIIAPEFDQLLESCTTAIDRNCVHLGCRADAIRLTADKLALAAHWTACGVKTPFTSLAVDWRPDRTPTVVKPRHGAGSQFTTVVRSNHEFRETLLRTMTQSRWEMIAQDYVPRIAASVSLLTGPRGCVALSPSEQLLTADNSFGYVGSRFGLSSELAARATRVAVAAAECVPGLAGYIGVDLVLGPATDGSTDFAIELNPRLTTSYLGLRLGTESNLAELLRRAAFGQQFTVPKWKSGSWEFWVDDRLV